MTVSNTRECGEASGRVRWESARTAALLGAAALAFLWYALRFFNYAEDDAFIPIRYAQNFWRGAGWVMNPGERVEGCTSPLHLWYVTALLRWATPDQSLLVSKFLGLALGLGVLWQTRSVGRRLLPQAAWVGDGAALVVALRPEFALSMINGLETGFATLLLTAGVARFLAESQGATPGDHRRSALLFVGAALTRPELALAFPALVMAGLWRTRDTGTARSLALYLLPLAALLLSRLAYYGDWAPNTFYAKQIPPAQALSLGAGYIRAYALPEGLWVALGALGLLGLLRHGQAGRSALPIVLGLHALFLLRCGGDWMMDGRFVTVVLPLCAALFAGGVWTSVRAARQLAPSARPGYVWAAVGAALLLPLLAVRDDLRFRVWRIAHTPGLHGVRFVLRPHPPLQAWMTGNEDGRLAIGHWIAGHAAPGQLVLSSEMGMATLQNPQIRFLDIRGLADRHIARLRGYFRDRGGLQGERLWQETDGPLGDYVRQRRPEWVVLLWDVYQPGLDGADRATGLYVPAGVFSVRLSGRLLHVATWRRRDVLAGPQAGAAAPEKGFHA